MSILISFDSVLNKNQSLFRLDAHFEIQKENILGIFGPSGAGKTLFLRCLAGLEKPSRSKIVVNDVVWQDSTSGVFLPPYQRSVGYVFQEPRLFPHLTAKQNLEFVLKKSGYSKFESKHNEILNILDLKRCLEKYPHQLSGGEQQRVSIARAAFTDPDLLLLDEPLSALDVDLKNEIILMLKALTNVLKWVVLYVTHDMSELLQLADYVTVVKNGSYSHINTINNLLSDHNSLFPYQKNAINIVNGRIESIHSPGKLLVLSEIGELLIPNFDHSEAEVGRQIKLIIPVRDISIFIKKPEEKGRANINVLSAIIYRIAVDNKNFATIFLLAQSVLIVSHVQKEMLHFMNLSVGIKIFMQINSIRFLQ